MAKNWLPFSAGLLCGAALTAGLLLTRPRSPQPVAAPAPTRPALAQPTARLAAESESSQSSPKSPSLPQQIAQLVRWVEGREPSLNENGVLQILDAWSAVDADAALQFVANAKRFPNRSAALARPLAVIARRDVAKAIAWLEKNQLEAERGNTAEHMIDLIVADDPARALQLAEADRIPVDLEYFKHVLGALVKRNPAQALQGFSRLSESGQARTARAFVSAWAETDPAAAARWCESQRTAPFAADCVTGLLETASQQKDFAALRSLIQRFNPPQESLSRLMWRGDSLASPAFAQEVLSVLTGEARVETAQSWALRNLEKSPDEVLRIITSLLPPDARAPALNRGFSMWLESDRKAATEWLDALPDRALADQLRATATEHLARAEPEAYLQLAATRVDVSPHMQESVVMALAALAERSPSAAADWISRNPTKVPPELVAGVTSEYIGRDAAAGSQWISTLPAGPLRDSALSAAATHWVEQNEIAFATESVNAIAEPSRRLATMFSVFSDMNQRDPAAAMRWAENQGLSEETRITWAAIAKR